MFTYAAKLEQILSISEFAFLNVVGLVYVFMTLIYLMNITQKRRFQRRCVHVYKYLNELITHELTLETKQHQHNCNTRNKVNLTHPCVKRNWGKQRTTYHTVNDFNYLSEMIRDSAIVNIFNDRFIIFFNLSVL